MLMLWIQSRVDYINNLPLILSKTAQQQQAQPSLQHPSKGLDSSKLEHTWFNILTSSDLTQGVCTGLLEVEVRGIWS